MGITECVAQLDEKVSYDLLIVLPPSLASAFVIYHHATELALMLAGLLPHDGSAGGGGAAGHGCCRWTERINGRQEKERAQKDVRKFQYRDRSGGGVE